MCFQLSSPPEDVARVQSLLGIYRCSVCYEDFASRSGLGRHVQASGHCAHGPISLPKTIQPRVSYNFRRKRKLIQQTLQATEELHGDTKMARKLVSAETGVSEINLYNWVRDKDHIFRCADTWVLGGKCRVRVSQPRWPEAEMMLYFRFIYRRRYQALRVSRRWLRSSFKDIRANLAHDVDNWYPSGGWCTNFCKRWDITSQCRTNKKKFR